MWKREWHTLSARIDSILEAGEFFRKSTGDSQNDQYGTRGQLLEHAKAVGEQIKLLHNCATLGAWSIAKCICSTRLCGRGQGLPGRRLRHKHPVQARVLSSNRGQEVAARGTVDLRSQSSDPDIGRSPAVSTNANFNVGLQGRSCRLRPYSGTLAAKVRDGDYTSGDANGSSSGGVPPVNNFPGSATQCTSPLGSTKRNESSSDCSTLSSSSTSLT